MSGNHWHERGHDTGLAPYVLWALAITAAVGGFLYLDGHFDGAIEQTTEAASQLLGPG